MTALTKKILAECFTKKDALNHLTDLKFLGQEYFFGNKDIDRTAKVALEGVNKDNLEDIFARVQKEVEDTSELTLYLNFVPTDEVKNDVGRRARKLFGPATLLDFRVDPGLIAGAALAFGGVYKDYSVRSKLEKYDKEIREIFFRRLGNFQDLS